MCGFGASRISQNLYSATVPGSRFALQGIHLQAHREIGEFFRGDRFYALGIDSLFMAAEGTEEILGFLEFTGIVLLAVLCPPLAAEVGLVLAAFHFAEAREREEIYQALIDPEVVRARAEIEAELFAAELGLALAFLPIAGELFGELRAMIRAAQKGIETAEAAGAAGRRAAASSAEEAALHLARVLERGLAESFALEMAKMWAINKVIGWVISPIMDEIRKTASPGGLERAMNELVVRMRERRLQSPEAGTQ
jgi:hypothetical protein